MSQVNIEIPNLVELKVLSFDRRPFGRQRVKIAVYVNGEINSERWYERGDSNTLTIKFHGDIE